MAENSLQSFLARVTMQEMLAGAFKACSEKCVPTPESVLSAKEKQCLAMCIDRYEEAFNITLTKQLSQLGQGLEHGHGHEH